MTNPTYADGMEAAALIAETKGSNSNADIEMTARCIAAAIRAAAKSPPHGDEEKRP